MKDLKEIVWYCFNNYQKRRTEKPIAVQENPTVYGEFIAYGLVWRMQIPHPFTEEAIKAEFKRGISYAQKHLSNAQASYDPGWVSEHYSAQIRTYREIAAWAQIDLQE